MNRRWFFTSLASTVIGSVGPTICAAQTVSKVFRIGVLGWDRGEWTSKAWKEFVSELQRLGYVEGRNIVFEKRIAADQSQVDRLDKFAKELVDQNVDVIYSMVGSQGGLAAKRATTKIPIVFNGSADPVGVGLVASLARPGGNATGSSIAEADSTAKAMQYLLEASGRKGDIVFLHASGTEFLPWYAGYAESMKRAAHFLRVNVVFRKVDTLSELERVAKQLGRQKASGVILLGEQKFDAHEERIAAMFVENMLPSVGDPRKGFLLGTRIPENLIPQNSARYIDRILRGAKPSDLPVEEASSFQLVISLKTAAALGLSIRQSLLMQADELIR